uniref:Uncharacterized protein n=1 Tax=Zea mays TaxID=4577 RepID=C4J3W7_MAIZE|nr:unknown [Zea mays]ACR35927.1 unknown [Zea mays]ACR36262.1 unknown [Zea mays]ACR36749.1 unknown [Zea mays]|eukprot:NP_001183151.1 uncharacterized protein LOC100501521 [Zea mays]
MERRALPRQHRVGPGEVPERGAGAGAEERGRGLLRHALSHATGGGHLHGDDAPATLPVDSLLRRQDRDRHEDEQEHSGDGGGENGHRRRRRRRRRRPILPSAGGGSAPPRVGLREQRRARAPVQRRRRIGNGRDHGCLRKETNTRL